MAHIFHLIDTDGNKVAVESNKVNSKKYAGYNVDIEWYKTHGYVEAGEFFRSLEKKYKYLTPEHSQNLQDSY